jgi:membrane-associated protein
MAMFETLKTVVEIFLHIDKYLASIIAQYGPATYAILFTIVFMETGLVITPFLPGDSLLFAAGTFAAIGSFDIVLLLLLLIVAAFLGDTVNYWIGHTIGPVAFEKDNRFFKKEHLLKAQHFYEKHGGIAIVIARFVPIVRTFAPFVAGISKMNYFQFLFYNLIGGIIWVGLFTLAGYFFGNVPFVRDNFHYAMIVIVLASVLPMMYEFWKHTREKKTTNL